MKKYAGIVFALAAALGVLAGCAGEKSGAEAAEISVSSELEQEETAEQNEETSKTEVQEEIPAATEAPASPEPAQEKPPEAENLYGFMERAWESYNPELMPEEKLVEVSNSDSIWLAGEESRKLQDLLKKLYVVEYTEDVPHTDTFLFHVTFFDANDTSPSLRTHLSFYRNENTPYPISMSYSIAYYPTGLNSGEFVYEDKDFWVWQPAGTDVGEELQKLYDAAAVRLKNAIPEEGMPLLDILPETWDKVYVRVRWSETGFELTEEDMGKLKEILSTVTIKTQIPLHHVKGWNASLRFNDGKSLSPRGKEIDTNAYPSSETATLVLSDDTDTDRYMEEILSLCQKYQPYE